MSIAPIPPISLPPTGPTAAAGSAGAAAGGGGANDVFSAIGDALETVDAAHNRVDDLAAQAATGDLTAVHELTMATAEAQLMTSLTVEIRNRAVESFNEIMRMQV
ncbi:MAG: flagellar hook-basal body complex protein FliE [Actinomycetota bacterium]